MPSRTSERMTRRLDVRRSSRTSSRVAVFALFIAFLSLQARADSSLPGAQGDILCEAIASHIAGSRTVCLLGITLRAATSNLLLESLQRRHDGCGRRVEDICNLRGWGAR